MENLVTKESLVRLLDSGRRADVVGRALVAIFKINQTADEQSSNDTRQFNGIGFSGADARSGSITAKYYIKHGRLLEWQVDRWTALTKNGYPRLCKYAKQLNEIAVQKAAARQQSAQGVTQ